MVLDGLTAWRTGADSGEDLVLRRGEGVGGRRASRVDGVGERSEVSLGGGEGGAVAASEEGGRDAKVEAV
jgi:hypothetical protein